MKKIIYLFILLPFAISSQCRVNVELTQKQSYCGGAKPPPELLAQLEKPIPYANKKLVLVSANGKTTTVSTNSKGILKLKLKPGSYKLYEPWRFYKKTPDNSDIKNFDKTCLEPQWNKADVTIETQKDKKQ